jgi:phosphonate degradation associated HDIG domain protein
LHALTIPEVLRLFRTRGEHTYGEAISQTQHALQGARLALAEGCEEALVLATLLHDIGHLFAPEPLGGLSDEDEKHEAIGAEALRPLFGPAVSQPVALHVAAKRYLSAVDPGYFATISPASRHTLIQQGGPFSVAQIRHFESLPYWRDALTLRRFDEAAKSSEPAPGDIADYLPLMEEVARRAAQSR